MIIAQKTSNPDQIEKKFNVDIRYAWFESSASLTASNNTLQLNNQNIIILPMLHASIWIGIFLN